MSQLYGRSLLSLQELNPLEIEYLLSLSQRLKQERQEGYRPLRLLSKNIALLFEKPSTRTRCAFEVAAFDEGACVTTLTDSHAGIKESIRDTANVLGRFYDGIQFRGFAQETVEELAKYAGVPVWNGLTDDFHPTQTLADLLTMRECVSKPLNAVKLVYVGDARNNVAHTLLIAAAKLGMHFVAVAPEKLQPKKELLNSLAREITQSGAKITVTTDIAAGVAGADFIYTDIWISMGEEDEIAERLPMLLPYQVNSAMMQMTNNPKTIFLHCLPSWHNMETEIGQQLYKEYGITALEVTDEVFYSDNSKVFQQAENRLHTIKAILLATMLPVNEL
jgi:ornithine carbamoyltransferase